jgi:predicted transcriptional regulator
MCRPSILGYFAANYPLDASIFSYSIGDLKIGTYGRIFSGNPTTPLSTLLETCLKKCISSVPIVDENGVLLDIFSRSDVMNIAAEAEHNLDSTIADVTNAYPNHDVYVCKRQDTLRAVLQHMMRTGAQRLFCITDNKAVEGVVSVGDVFKFFVELEGLSSEWTK